MPLYWIVINIHISSLPNIFALTESGKRLDHRRLVVPHCLHRGEVVVEEIDPVTLEDPVSPGWLPPGDLEAGLGHREETDLARRTRSWKKSVQMIATCSCAYDSFPCSTRMSSISFCLHYHWAGPQRHAHKPSVI